MRNGHQSFGLLLTLIMVSSGQTLAQTCGTMLPEEAIPLLIERRNAGLYDAPNEFLPDPTPIRIKWHVVTSSLGERSIEESALEDYLEAANDAFFDSNMYFCADPNIHYIVDDDLFVNVPSHYALRMMEPASGAINIYWCSSIQGGNLCGTSSYTVSPVQGIVMQTTCMGYNDMRGVLIHEIGHYFDLYHTHENGFGFECAEGSDCATTGDHICDTSPAPYLGFEECVEPIDCSLIESNPACTDAPGPPLCPEGQSYQPDTDNYMSYTAVPCLNNFTRGQLDRARATLLNFRFELLEHSCTLNDACMGDINQDGQVGPLDLTAVLGSWRTSDMRADLNGDGIVNGGDVTIILANWQACD